MKVQIKNRWNDAVLFTADVPDGTESGMTTRLALEQAVEVRAYLRDAYLRGAYLRDAYLGGANLRGANLGGADLGGANLRGAYLGDLTSIWRTSGNLREIKAIQCDTWPVAYTATHMQIGCQLHKLERWWSFTDEQIGRMDSSALAWWRQWKPILQQIVAMSPAVPGSEKPAEKEAA